MTVRLLPLADGIADLRGGARDATEYTAELYERVDALEADVRAWIGGPKRREWVECETAAIAERHPDSGSRPPLYGVPVGVKDIFHVDGLPTRAGSDLPPSELVETQAAAVTTLRDAGALVFGKTVTTEFAYFEPGQTRNPHDYATRPAGRAVSRQPPSRPGCARWHSEPRPLGL